MKTPITLLFAFGLASCGDPNKFVRKAHVIPGGNAVADASKVIKPSAPVASVNTDLDDGLRLGDDILALPSPEQLRSSPNTTGDGNATPIITRPPAE